MSDQNPLLGDARNGNGAGFGSAAGLGSPELRASVQEGEEMVREFIRRHPVPVVLGALALGFAVARLLRED
jgi:hypothetical protein